MSRCMPFPPPWYELEGLSGEALIELIKARGEQAQEAERRLKKEERRRRRRRMRRKREEDELENGEIKKKKHHHHKRHKHHRRKHSEINDNQKSGELDSPGLEKSNLTEELKQPAVADSLYDSSDNGQNIKSKRTCWSPYDRCHSNECSVWIDIQVQKHKDQETELCPIEQKPASTGSCIEEKPWAIRGRSSYFNKQCGESTARALGSAIPHRQLLHSSSQAEAVLSTCSATGLQHIESKFEELIVKWVPPHIECNILEPENVEWLFETDAKRLAGRNATQVAAAGNFSPALWPTTQYLPRADLYALPFTILF